MLMYFFSFGLFKYIIFPKSAPSLQLGAIKAYHGITENTRTNTEETFNF